MQENILNPLAPDKNQAANPPKAAAMEADGNPRWRIWLGQMRQALGRAEIHITENFKVPPGGG